MAECFEPMREGTCLPRTGGRSPSARWWPRRHALVLATPASAQFGALKKKLKGRPPGRPSPPSSEQGRRDHGAHRARPARRPAPRHPPARGHNDRPHRRRARPPGAGLKAGEAERAAWRRRKTPHTAGTRRPRRPTRRRSPSARAADPCPTGGGEREADGQVQRDGPMVAAQGKGDKALCRLHRFGDGHDGPDLHGQAADPAGQLLRRPARGRQPGGGRR